MQEALIENKVLITAACPRPYFIYHLPCSNCEHISDQVNQFVYCSAAPSQMFCPDQVLSQNPLVHLHWMDLVDFILKDACGSS